MRVAATREIFCADLFRSDPGRSAQIGAHGAFRIRGNQTQTTGCSRLFASLDLGGITADLLKGTAIETAFAVVAHLAPDGRRHIEAGQGKGGVGGRTPPGP